MMRKAPVYLILVSITLGGCAPGFIYTNTITPYCTDLRGTKLGSNTGKGSTKRVSIPVGQVDLTAVWSSRGLHDAAQSHGLKTINACDEHMVSVLGGIWRRQEILVYGE
jgi:hypothetical protein